MPVRLVGPARAALALALVALGASPSLALPDVLGFRSRNQLSTLNEKLAGRLVDFTNNHGVDRRICSPVLGSRRDVYVYLPPGYDGVRLFPVMLFLHGLGQDEKIFLDVVPEFDAAIRAGTAAPMVIVVPDGTVNGSPSLTSAGSFWINSKAGNFGDYLVRDVWHWALANFAVRPEREAHVVAGASMGGFGAYNVAFKNKSEFAHVVGIMPPLNMRYGDCDGRYLSDYDPSCFKLRFVGRRNEVVGVFYGGLLIRSRRLLDPLVGADAAPEEANAFVSRENPYEMLRRYGVRPGEFNLFVGYGKRDEFNIDAQVESFVDECARMGIFPTTLVLPRGRHNVATALDMIPALNQWTFEKLAPYVPADFVPPTRNVLVRPVVATRNLRGVELGGWETVPAKPPKGTYP